MSHPERKRLILNAELASRVGDSSYDDGNSIVHEILIKHPGGSEPVTFTVDLRRKDGEKFMCSIELISAALQIDQKFLPEHELAREKFFRGVYLLKPNYVLVGYFDIESLGYSDLNLSYTNLSHDQFTHAGPSGNTADFQDLHSDFAMKKKISTGIITSLQTATINPDIITNIGTFVMIAGIGMVCYAGIKHHL